MGSPSEMTTQTQFVTHLKVFLSSSWSYTHVWDLHIALGVWSTGLLKANMYPGISLAAAGGFAEAYSLAEARISTQFNRR